MSHPSGLLVLSPLVLEPHYLSLASFRCLTCFTPPLTTCLYTIIIGPSPIPLLHFTKHFPASSLCVCLLFFNISLLSLSQETWFQPSPCGNFTLMVSQSSLGCQNKILWIKGLKTTAIYSSQFWWLEFKIKVPQIPCLVRPHTSFLCPHLWSLLYKGAHSTHGARVAQR